MALSQNHHQHKWILSETSAECHCVKAERWIGLFPIINESQVRAGQSEGESKLRKRPIHFPVVNESQVRRAQSDGEEKLKNGLVYFQ